MRKHFLLALQLGVLGVLVVWNNVLGLDSGMYEKIWWWDIVSHFLGGLWFATFAAWCAEYCGVHLTIGWCVFSAFAIGVAWEVFEYTEDLQGSPYWAWQFEIAKDLFNDALGGLVAGYLVAYRRRRQRRA